MKRLVLLCIAVLTSWAVAAAPETGLSAELLSRLLPVNINTATESELTSLDGIDITLARAIIDYRQTNGPFKTIEDMRKVPGITAKEFERIRDRISISGSKTLSLGLALKKTDKSGDKDHFDVATSAPPPPEATPAKIPTPQPAPSTDAPSTKLPAIPPPKQMAPGPKHVTQQAEKGVPSATTTIVTNEVAAVDEYYAELKQANIVFSAPESMDQNETSKVNLWLDPTATLASLENALKAIVENTQRVESASAIKWAPRTRAILSSPGFDIAPQPEIELAVSATARTEWVWQIRPKESGKQTLHLSLEAIVPCQGKDCVRVIKTFDRDIDVRITATDFLEQNWQWLVATLILPFAVWVWNRRRSPRRRTLASSTHYSLKPSDTTK